MTFSQFLSESQNIMSMISQILNGIPGIIITILFTAVAFSIVIAIVNMLRGIRS